MKHNKATVRENFEDHIDQISIDMDNGTIITFFKDKGKFKVAELDRKQFEIMFTYEPGALFSMHLYFKPKK